MNRPTDAIESACCIDLRRSDVDETCANFKKKCVRFNY